MSVDRDEVTRIAELAKLDLDAAEADRLTQEMNRILDYAERLRGLDPSSTPVEDTVAGAGDFAGTSAADAATEAGPRDGGSDASGADPLIHPPSAFAPEMQEGFFTVPPPPGVAGPDRE